MSALRKLMEKMRLARDHGAVAEARAERKKSESRLAVTQRTVIEPLAAMHRENHFAEMIMNTLRGKGEQ